MTREVKYGRLAALQNANARKQRLARWLVFANWLVWPAVALLIAVAWWLQ